MNISERHNGNEMPLPNRVFVVKMYDYYDEEENKNYHGDFEIGMRYDNEFHLGTYREGAHDYNKESFERNVKYWWYIYD